MPDKNVSRATRLRDKLAEEMTRKRQWADENREIPYGMQETGAGGLRGAYRSARTPEERRALMDANGGQEAFMKKLKGNKPLPGLED